MKQVFLLQKIMHDGLSYPANMPMNYFPDTKEVQHPTEYARVRVADHEISEGFKFIPFENTYKGVARKDGKEFFEARLGGYSFKINVYSGKKVEVMILEPVSSISQTCPLHADGDFDSVMDAIVFCNRIANDLDLLAK